MSGLQKLQKLFRHPYVFVQYGHCKAVDIIHSFYYIHGPWRDISPKKMSLIVLTLKRTVLGRNHVIWAIKHDYRPRSSSWACEEEKRTVQDRTGQDRKKSPKGYISPIWGEAPLMRSTSKLCSKCRSRRIHVC